MGGALTVTVSQLAASDDLSGAIALLQKFFREEGFTTEPEVIAANTQILAGLPNCALFLASAGDVAVGVATLSLEFGIEFGWSAEMGDLYVLPAWRGNGVARLLTGAIEDFLAARGATGYQVTVTPFAEAHHGLGSFYRKLGFDGEGRLILYKRLSSRST